jgi:lipoprotein-releasing system permease protein
MKQTFPLSQNPTESKKSVIGIKKFISTRFVLAKKETRIINVITAISISGIVIGAAVICVVLSTLNGFRGIVTNLFLTIDGNVQLVAKTGKSFRLTQAQLASLRELPEIESAEQFLEGKALIAAKDKSSVVILKAIEPDALRYLKGYMDIGRGIGENRLAVGGGVANRLGLMFETEVALMSAKTIDKGLEAIQNPLATAPPKLPVFTIDNFFRSHRVYDDIYALATFQTGKFIFDYQPDEITGVDVRPKKDLFGKSISDEVLREALSKWMQREGLSETAQLSSLEDKYSDLFRVMKLEKWGSFIALMLIILVASLSLIGSLTMTAIEKRRDLYFLRCIGLSPKDIEHIFLIEGALIGAIGVAVGLTLGFAVSYLQQQYGWVKLPYGNAFIVKAYPIAMEWQDFFCVGVATFLVSLLASLYPAKRAARLSEKLSVNRE